MKMKHNTAVLLFITLVITAHSYSYTVHSPDTATTPDNASASFLHFSDQPLFRQGIWSFTPNYPTSRAIISQSGSLYRRTLFTIDNIPFYSPLTGQPDLNLFSQENFHSISSVFTNTFHSPSIMLTTHLADTDKPLTKITYKNGGNSFSDINVTYNQHVSQPLQIKAGFQIMSYGQENEIDHLKKNEIRAVFRYCPNKNMQFFYNLITADKKRILPWDIQLFNTYTRSAPSLNHQARLHLFRSRIKHGSMTTRFRMYYFSEEITFADNISIPGQTLYLNLEQGLDSLPLRWRISLYRQRASALDSTYSSTLSRVSARYLFPLPHNARLLLLLQAAYLSDSYFRFLPGLFLNLNLTEKILVKTGLSQQTRKPSFSEKSGLAVSLSPGLYGLEDKSFWPPTYGSGQAEAAPVEEELSTYYFTTLSTPFSHGFVAELHCFFEQISQPLLFNPETCTFRNSRLPEKRTGISVGLLSAEKKPLTLKTNFLIQTFLNSVNGYNFLRPRLLANIQLGLSIYLFQQDLHLMTSAFLQINDGMNVLSSTGDNSLAYVSSDPVLTSQFRINARIKNTVNLFFTINNFFNKNTSRLYPDISTMKSGFFGVSWLLYN